MFPNKEKKLFNKIVDQLNKNAKNSSTIYDQTKSTNKKKNRIINIKL